MAFKFNEYHLGGTGGKPAVIEPITIKENGTYNAPDGVDGYSPITVDVAGTGGGGSGGKEPVLGELVVTESGVYDAPTSATPLDPNQSFEGLTLKFKEHIELSAELLDLLSEEVVHTLVRWTADYNSKQNYLQFRRNSDGIFTVAFTHYDRTTYTYEQWIYFSDAEEHYAMGECPICAEVFGSGWYKTYFVQGGESAANGGYTVKSPAPSIYLPRTDEVSYSKDVGEQTKRLLVGMCEGVTCPADGWNKVTVDSSIGFVDVLELPYDGHISHAKIVRLMGDSIEAKKIYELYDDGYVVDLINELSLYGTHVDITTVDEFPNAPNISTFDAFHVYVMRETGEPFVYASNQWLTYAQWMGYDGFEYKGIIESIDEMTEAGYYVLVNKGKKPVCYGIADDTPVKRLVDGEWVELT